VRRLPLLSIFFAVVGIFFLTLPSRLPADPPPYDNIKIGAILDLTGPHGTRGQLHLKGMEDYFRYINEAASGISGQKIVVAFVDSGAQIADVLKDVEKSCVSEKMDMAAVFNPNIREKTRAIFEQHKVPHIDATNRIKQLHPPVPYTYFPFGSTDLHCYAILQYIEMTHKGPDPPKIGVLTADDACGKSIHGPTKTYASNHGLQIVAVMEFTPGTPDLKPLMLKLKNAGIEYIFMQCTPTDAITALESADRINYNVLFFSAWTLLDDDFFDLGKKLIRRRTNISFPGCLPGDGSAGINLVKILMDRYKSVSGFHTAYWEGVSIAAIMARALQRAHGALGKIDGPTVNLALETFEKEDFGALIPDVTYTDANHDASFVTRIVRVEKNRTFTPLTKFWNPKTEKVAIIP